MKRLLLLMLCAALMAACQPAPANVVPAPPIERRAVYIPFPIPIKLDGDLSDWANVQKVTVTEGKHFGSTPDNNGAFTFALAATPGNLYVMMTTPDQEIIAGRGDYWLEDSFEFFLNFTGDLAATTYREGIVQVIVNAVHIGAEPGTQHISGQNIPPGTEAITFYTADGWGVEARVPLHSANAPEHGRVIGFQAYGNGGNRWGRSSHLIWSHKDPDGEAWQRPNVFGQGIYYELGKQNHPQPIVVSGAGMQPGTWGDIVTEAWRVYREQYIFCGEPCANNLGIVFDPSIDYIAVSEGVGYGMLLAVMLDDQYTFDTIYDGAHRAMLDETNSLHNWRLNSKGTVTDTYSATDAEQDIAIALIFAQQRVDDGTWQQHPTRPYDERARHLLDQIYNIQVIDGRYLSPGTLQGFDGRNLTNPSYFSPAWYRIYNAFENSTRWQPLIDEGYALLETTPGASRGLAPDWTSAQGTSALEHCRQNNINLNNCQFTMRYDAIRVPWRIGTDCLWFAEPHACAWSQRSHAFLESLPPVQTALLYDLSGKPIVDYQDEVMLSMWYFAALAADDPFFAAELAGQLHTFGDPAQNGYWGETAETYYNQSLALFAATWITGDFRNLYRQPRPSGSPANRPISPTR